MPRATYGPQVKARTLRLFEALLHFANDELDECDRLDIKFRWDSKDSTNPKLLIKTKLRTLEELTKRDNHEGSLTKTQIREALYRMQNFLGILEDNRPQNRGSEEWNFTLSLWSKETAKNLLQFEQNWENKRPEKSKRQEETANTTSKNDKVDYPASGVKPTKIPHNLPRSGVVQFVGRDEALLLLHEQLQQCDRIAVCAVAGMGGVGKTELALQYALSHQQLSTYPGGLCWIQAGEVAFATQIVNFARVQLGLQLPDELELLEQVAYCWRNWIAGDVLLVLDDVRDYQQVKPYLPPTESRFKVLITTRQQELGESFKTLRLSVLTPDAAIALLVSFVGQERIEQERDQAEHLCKQLGYLPWGLELVGRYLKRKPDLSLAQMRQRLDLKHRSLQNPSQETTARLGVEAAFELSWQELDEVAQELGCLLSLFAVAPIPWSWVKQCLPDRDAEVLEDARDYALLNLSLLERPSQGTYQLHQLIREFLRGKLDQLAEADQLKERFCQVMVAAAQQIPDTPIRQDIITATPMIPHLAEAASVYQEWLRDEDLIWPFIGLGRFYSGQGAYEQALPWYKLCVSVTKKRLTEEHPTVATSLNNLAELYYSQGRYAEAEPLLHQASELWKRLLGEEHPAVAQSLNNLANLYESQGRYTEAEPLFLQALELRKRLLGQEHPDVAQSLNNLAELYYSQGRYTEAEPLLHQALELWKRLLGEEHPAVAQSLNNLANLYNSQGRYTEAEPLFLQALELSKRLLGQEHPHVATILNNLAYLYDSQGRYDQAEPLLTQALELRKRLLGEEHPDTATSLNDLANLYSTQGKYDQAEPLLIQALALRKRLLGEEHPLVTQSRNNLVNLYLVQGRHDTAEFPVVIYDVLLRVSSEAVRVGDELEASLYLTPVANRDNTAALLKVQPAEAVGNELNIFLTAPSFLFNSDNTTSLPLEPDSSSEVFPQQPTQTAHFSLTALRPGSTTIKAEVFCGDSFKRTIETEVQVAGFNATELRSLIAARSRPVPQPDLILQVRTAWSNDTSAFTFRYHIDTFQQRLLFADDSDYCSKSLPAGWVERSHLLLKTTLEDAASSLPEDFRSRLASLGQYLFQSLLPAELQSIFRSIAGFNRPFTWLILADQDAWFPWELLHDGQTFLGDRFIIGRWLWELDKARPYEFPVGAVNVAHYASVEQPEVWTALLEPPGAPPPIPLPGGVLADLSSTESMRGLHLIRFGQSSDTANRRDAPVLVNGGSGNLDIEREVQPAKLSLRRNRPLVTLGYMSAGQPELTALEHTWASTFVRAGCSAFVGSLWAVQPDVEAAFVSGFYHNLWAGQSLGMAFQAARSLARAVAPDSLDWLAYVLFGDPMARPYRPVEGQGYAVVEPIGQEIDDPVPPRATVRFRVSLRRTPPVWYENRLMEVAEDLAFEDLQVFIVTSGLQVTPADSVEMRRTPTGDYLGWFSLSVPREMESQSVLVQVFFEDGMEPVHSLRFQVKIGNRDGEGR